MATSMADESEAHDRKMQLSPAFDANYYLAANPDLRLSRDEAAAHYARIGRSEGRVASPLALRENLVAMIDDGRSVLEIGPFCDPLLRGPNIAYLDILDAEQLRARATETGRDAAGCPAWIDYVGGLEQVRRRFDAMISSHAIEHQPDLVHHLEQAERVLAPDGLLCLIIPDKRYCFDHHIAESTIADVLQAHREHRRTHRLGSVVEHIALTTHNDSPRHWAGDHGPRLPADLPARLHKALNDYEASAGGYIDVHAWYFTPDSFRSIVEALAALGLTGFEIVEVYDTARGRNEFCAVLRLGEKARARAHKRRDDSDVIVLQTADADRYLPMLAVTAANVREYCRRHGHGYESFVGVKRGFHAWQATFNRIPMLVELVERGFTGWALYLDADAYIQDLDFDLAAYLADKQDRAAIFATSGVTGEAWDVNAGVALINLGHPLGRALVAQWAAGFAAHSDDALRAGEEWFGAGNDQDLLHQILKRDGAIAAAVLVEQTAFINGPHSSFIRQRLRAQHPGFEQRLRALSDAVAEIFWREGKPGAVRPALADERWSGRLAHREGLQPALVEAPVPTPRVDIARAICAAWAKAATVDLDAGPVWGPLIEDFQRDFVDALARKDDAAVASELAALGRAKLSQGFFGGARQHERARSRQFADRLARWTYDKLVSLAEAVGVLPLESPENGRWGFNARIDPAELFDRIQARLGVDLSPPPYIGGHLGIAVGGGMVLHMRMLDSIHAAWRLRQLADTLGLGGDARIAEIGPGAALTAFYALRLGLTHYRLFDLPTMNAVQAYVLAGAGYAVSLHSEEQQPVAILPGSAFSALEPRSVDILFNADSLPEIERRAALGYLADARRICVGHLLSINQEAGLPDQISVPELVREAGGYRLASRHRHWLRAGYVEEHYIGIE